MKDLNTMDTFNNGFKIERNGEIITLTSEEMARFRFLDIALTGRNCLDCYLDYLDCLENNNKNKEIVDELYHYTDRPLPSEVIEHFEEVGFKGSEIWSCEDEWKQNEKPIGEANVIFETTVKNMKG